MSKLPNKSGPVFSKIAEYLDEIFEMDYITCATAPNVLPLESKEELLNFLEVEHNTKTFIWNDETGNTVGYLSYIDEPDNEGTVELLNLIVLPKYWRSGYGKEMVNHYLKLMKDAGFKKSKLVTSPENKEAINFYTKMGYIKGDVLKDYYGVGQDRVGTVQKLVDIFKRNWVI